MTMETMTKESLDYRGRRGAVVNQTSDSFDHYKAYQAAMDPKTIGHVFKRD